MWSFKDRKVAWIPRKEVGKRGGRRDLNPQRPEPQSGALPLSYDHHANAEDETNASSDSAKQILSGRRLPSPGLQFDISVRRPTD
jgi:hypothetical protein